MYGRDSAQAEATAEWRRRQNAAPWLRDASPQLKSLRLMFDEARTDGSHSGRAYASPVLVDSARARFEVRCLEPRCDGMHDLTAQVLRAIQEHRKADCIRSPCDGYINQQHQCSRTLVCSLEIGYRD